MFRKLMARRRRQLFAYHDGRARRRIDPLEAFHAVQNDEEYNPGVHPALVDDGDPEAVGVMVRMVRRVFGVERYSDATAVGLTNVETIEIFLAFCDYIDRLKKNTSNSWIWHPVMADPTSRGSSAPTTNDTPPVSSSCRDASTDAPISSG